MERSVSGWPVMLFIMTAALLMLFLPALTAALFLSDLVIPDLIPFVDELLLGLASAMFATLRDKRQVREK